MEMLCGPDGEIPDKLKNIEPRLIEHISNEIMEKDPNVRWSDIGTSANSNVPDRQSILVFFYLNLVPFFHFSWHIPMFTQGMKSNIH
jgi:hypothetical protein